MTKTSLRDVTLGTNTSARIATASLISWSLLNQRVFCKSKAFFAQEVVNRVLNIVALDDSHPRLMIKK